jgi:hypothetical protein
MCCRVIECLEGLQRKIGRSRNFYCIARVLTVLPGKRLIYGFRDPGSALSAYREIGVPDPAILRGSGKVRSVEGVFQVT